MYHFYIHISHYIHYIRYMLVLAIRDSSSDEEEIVNKKKNSKKMSRSKQLESEDENGGFLSDGYDADLFGDSEDRGRLLAMTEVEREAILYERAQARQARQERRSLEQRIREREEMASGKRAPSKEIDLKRKKLSELKAKRQKKLSSYESGEEDEEEGEEGEFESEESSEDEQERKRVNKKKKSRKSRKDDSDEDYYTEDEKEIVEKTGKTKISTFSKQVDIESDREVADELNLDMANKLRLSRDILAQWVYREGFEDICQKCLLRINLGAGRDGNPIYRVVELKKIVSHHRSYLIKPGTPTNLAALVKFAKNERIFSFEFVSNSSFTQSELDFWKKECERANVRIPFDNVSAKRKIDKLKAFHTEPLSDAMISKMLEHRKELTSAQNAPRNLLAEQTILQQQLKEALERANADEEVARIETELAAIHTKRQANESKDRLGGMEDLNRRNRLTNLETGRQAEITRIQSELTPLSDQSGTNSDKQKKAPTLDPFQRRKCKPTLIHMQDKEGEMEIEEPKEEEKKQTSAQISSSSETTDTPVKETANLFDVHNFDIDIDI